MIKRSKGSPNGGEDAARKSFAGHHRQQVEDGEPCQKDCQHNRLAASDADTRHPTILHIKVDLAEPFPVALTFPLQKPLHLRRFLVGENAGGGKRFGADAAIAMAPTVDDGVAPGATALLASISIFGEQRGGVTAAPGADPLLEF